jgi:hypothetical protein
MMDQVGAEPIASLHDVEALIVDDAEFAELEGLIRPFNIFEALAIVFQETRHSDFLAFLCDPSQNHGLGDRFVRRFLQKAVAENSSSSTISPLDLDLYDMDEVEVRREWQSIDLFLVDRVNRLVVILENKVRSAEHGDQLARYWTSAERHFPNYSLLGLFLSPDASPPSDDRYTPVGYELVCDLVESLAPSVGADAEMLMTHYAQMVRRNILENTRLAELCRSINRRHRKALDLLFQYRYDRQEEIRALLSELIQESASIIIPDTSTKNFVRFCPVAWEGSALLKEGAGWTPSGRMLLFEFNNSPTRLTLKLTIGPGPEPTRRRLLEAAIANSRAFDGVGKTLGKYTNMIFQREVLGARALAELDFELVSDAVRKFWDPFLTDTMPVLVEAIRGERWLWPSN